MAEGDREVLVTIRPQFDTEDLAAQLKKIQDQDASIKIKVDGKELKSDISDVLKQLQSKGITTIPIEFDLSGMDKNSKEFKDIQKAVAQLIGSLNGATTDDLFNGLVAGVKEAQEEIERLKKKIEELENVSKGTGSGGLLDAGQFESFCSIIEAISINITDLKESIGDLNKDNLDFFSKDLYDNCQNISKVLGTLSDQLDGLQHAIAPYNSSTSQYDSYLKSLAEMLSVSKKFQDTLANGGSARSYFEELENEAAEAKDSISKLENAIDQLENKGIESGDFSSIDYKAILNLRVEIEKLQEKVRQSEMVHPFEQMIFAINEVSDSVKDLKTAFGTVDNEGFHSYLEKIKRDSADIYAALERIHDALGVWDEDFDYTPYLSALETLKKEQNSVTSSQTTLGIDETQLKEITTGIQSIIKALGELKDAFGTIDDSTGEFTPYLSQLDQIDNRLINVITSLYNVQKALGTFNADNSFTPFLNTLNDIEVELGELQTALSKVNMNFSLNLGSNKKNPIEQTREWSKAAKEAITLYKQAYDELVQLTMIGNNSLLNINQASTGRYTDARLSEESVISDLSASMSKRVDAYQDLIEKLRKAATDSGLNISSWVDQFDNDMTEMDNALNKVVSNSGDNSGVEALKNAFGNITSIDFSGILTQLDEIAKTLKEIQQLASAGIGIKTTSSTGDTSEANSMDTLEQAVGRVKDAVDKKTKAFTDEKAVVQQVITDEISNLDQLSKKITEIGTTVNQLDFSKLASDAAELAKQLDTVAIKFNSFSGDNNALAALKQAFTDLDTVMSKLNNSKGLNLELLSSEQVDKTVASLETLNDALDNVRNALGTQDTSGNFHSYLDGITTSIQEFTKSMTSIGDGQGLNTLVEGLKKLSTLDVNLENLKNIADQLTPLNTALNNLGGTGTGVQALVSGLAGLNEDTISKLERLNGIDLSKLNVEVKSKNFASFVESLTKLDGKNFDGLSALNGVDLSGFNSLTVAPKNITSFAEGMGKLVGKDFSGLRALSDVDLTGFSMLDIKTGQFNTLVEGAKQLAQIDTSKLEALSHVDLMGFNDIKVSEKSFTNLVNGIRELSKINLDELTKLADVDFSGLSNLENVGEVTQALASELKEYKTEQKKAINEAINTFLKAGGDETSKEVQELRQLIVELDTNFNLDSASGMDDLGTSMGLFSLKTQDAISNVTVLTQQMQAASKAATEEEKSYVKAINTVVRMSKKQTWSESETLNLKDALDTIQGASAKIASQYTDELTAAYNDLAAKLESIVTKGQSSLNGSVAGLGNYDALAADLKELDALQQKLKDTPDMFDQDDVTRVQELVNETAQLQKNLVASSTRGGNYLTTISSGSLDDLREYISLMAQAQNAQVSFGKVVNNGNGIEYSFTTANGSLQKYVATLDQTTGAVYTTMKSEEEYVSVGQRVINSITGKMQQLTVYISTMEVLQRVMQFVKEGVSSVIELDTAMTELRKVTDETEASYSNFLESIEKVATSVGSTAAELTEATADFARVGYSLDEAAEMAQDAAVLVNVSEYDSISDATEALIAMKAAYSDLDTEEIVDKINMVGNNFAVSSEELAEGLQNSASTLSLLGNSIDETAALLTAGMVMPGFIEI